MPGIEFIPTLHLQWSRPIPAFSARHEVIRETALRAQTQLIERHELGRFADPPLHIGGNKGNFPVLLTQMKEALKQ